jgi:hypothetical protein
MSTTNLDFVIELHDTIAYLKNTLFLIEAETYNDDVNIDAIRSMAQAGQSDDQQG